jgi:hypothetical protein
MMMEKAAVVPVGILTKNQRTINIAIKTAA